MAINKSHGFALVGLADSARMPAGTLGRSTLGAGRDLDSEVSFQPDQTQQSAKPGAGVRYAWAAGNDKVCGVCLLMGCSWGDARMGRVTADTQPCLSAQVNHDAFHRMVGEHRVAKKREGELELKIKQ
jgi:hypothetical protein